MLYHTINTEQSDSFLKMIRETLIRAGYEIRRQYEAGSALTFLAFSTLSSVAYNRVLILNTIGLTFLHQNLSVPFIIFPFLTQCSCIVFRVSVFEFIDDFLDSAEDTMFSFRMPSC